MFPFMTNSEGSLFLAGTDAGTQLTTRDDQPTHNPFQGPIEEHFDEQLFNWPDMLISWTNCLAGPALSSLLN